jgi:hypothetical protein
VLGAVLARATGRRAGRIELTLACGFAGIAYGALLNFSLMASYGGEFSLDRFAALEARAVPFDLAHAIGNVTLALVAGPAMVRMLMRFRERFEFRWPKSEVRNQKSEAALRAAGVAGLVWAIAMVGASGLQPRLAAAAPGGSSVSWLQRAENPDGGFPVAPGEDSSTEMTGWAILGLESAGVSPLDLGRGDRSPVDYLRRNIGEIRTAGDLARTILALRGAGVDPRHFARRDLTARLAGRRRRDGSYQGWPNSTAFAVMALRASDVRAGTSRSLSWLRRVQNADGGWGAIPAAPSDPDSTGAVLQALGGGSRAARRGVRYLRRSQHAAGGWALGESGPVNSQSTAWAIQGLLATGVDPSSVRSHGRNGLHYLAARRARDGHYRYSSSSDQTPVWVTSQALVAAQLKPFPLAPVPRAAAPGRGSARSGGGAASGRAGAVTGGGEGGAAAPSERFAPERASAKTGDRGRSSREWRVRKGPGTARSSKGDVAETRPVSSPAGSPDGDPGGGSPLLPIAIAVGAAGLALGGTWWATRRFLW